MKYACFCHRIITLKELQCDFNTNLEAFMTEVMKRDNLKIKVNIFLNNPDCKIHITSQAR